MINREHSEIKTIVIICQSTLFLVQIHFFVFQFDKICCLDSKEEYCILIWKTCIVTHGYSSGSRRNFQTHLYSCQIVNKECVQCKVDNLQ
jgi:hypothetical protein